MSSAESCASRGAVICVCIHTHTYLAIGRVQTWQKGGKGTLEHIRIATNGMRGVTIVRALAMEA